MLPKIVYHFFPEKNRKHNGIKFGLRSKFILSLLILILLPFLALGILVYMQSAKVIEQNVYRYRLETMRQMCKNVDYHLGEMERITQLLTSNEELTNYLENYNSLSGIEKIDVADKVNKFLINISGMRNELSGVYVFDLYNNFYYSRGKSPRLDYDYSHEKWFKDALAKAGGLNIIGTHLQYHVQTNPSYVISVSREIKSFESRKTIGAILVDFDYNILSNIIDNELNSTISGGNMYILDNEGTTIFNKNQEYLTQSFNYGFIKMILSNEYGTAVEYVNGQNALVVYYTSPYSSWKFVNIIPLNVILKDITFIKDSIIVIMIISLLLVCTFTLKVSHKLVKPIYSLVSAMSEMENGNFSTSLEIKTNDETRLLAESFNSMAKKIKNLIEKVYHSQLKQKESELNALQSQINPHFLYNTLDSIRGVAISEGVKSIDIMAKSLSRLFRYNICKGMEIVTLKEEIEHIKNYITIQNFRYEGKFEVEYNINKEFYSYKILKLILQPLVENAILHGLETKIGSGKITISCEMPKDIISIIVTDNGIGMPEDKTIELNNLLSNGIFIMEDLFNSNSKNMSIGITNVNSRIKLYFGNEYGLRYESKELNGTSAIITIPPIKEEKAYDQNTAGR